MNICLKITSNSNNVHSQLCLNIIIKNSIFIQITFFILSRLCSKKYTKKLLFKIALIKKIQDNTIV
jgi:hypothetical protein